METQGLHLRISRKQSEPSTIRALSTMCKTIALVFWPVGTSEFFLSSSAFGMKFQFAIVFPQKAKNTYGSTGDAGHCSPNLSHAKRALYRLSYIQNN